jgi:positive regulator of sigma E activity
MIERGKVIKNDGERIELEMHTGFSCEGCSVCFVDKNKRHILQVRQRLSIEPGDLVELEILPEFTIKSAFLLFFFPLLMLVFGYYLFHDLLLLPNIPAIYRGIIGALLGLLGSYVIVYTYDRILRHKSSDNHIRIIRVIKADQ